LGVDRDARDRFYVIEVRRRCRLVDVNIVGLREFMDFLPFKGMTRSAQAIAGDAVAADDTVSAVVARREKDQHKVWLVRRIGDAIHERVSALLLVERAAVESFDSVDPQHWVRRIFKLEDS